MGILRITGKERPPGWEKRTRMEVLEALGGKKFGDEPTPEGDFVLSIDDVEPHEVEQLRAAIQGLGVRIRDEEYLDT